jgi:hypothetical protein
MRRLLRFRTLSRKSRFLLLTNQSATVKRVGDANPTVAVVTSVIVLAAIFRIVLDESLATVPVETVTDLSAKATDLAVTSRIAQGVTGIGLSAAVAIGQDATLAMVAVSDLRAQPETPLN